MVESAGVPIRQKDVATRGWQAASRKAGDKTSMSLLDLNIGDRRCELEGFAFGWQKNDVVDSQSIGLTKESAFSTLHTDIFEAAHAMKGVCANLGLTKLSDAASDITEEFRPGKERTLSDDEVKNRIHSIQQIYSQTIDGIRRYEQSCE